MQARFLHTIDDLYDDFVDITRETPRAEVKIVREGIRTGNEVAKDNARRTSGTHGGPPKGHYIKAFSTEMHGWHGGFGVAIVSGEYGPDASKEQGNMEFENGSRNQPPHHDLARSADLIGGSFAREVGEMGERMFLDHGWR